jgi:hypothetical protein
MADSRFQVAAGELIDSRLERLRALTYADARQLPETAEEQAVVGGRRTSITVFRQDDPHGLPGCTLVTVLVARSAWFGLASNHVERGLVFSPRQPAREATARELENSGG